MNENVNYEMPATGYVSPRNSFALVSKFGTVEHRAAKPMTIEKKLKLVHAYCAFLQLAFDQSTLLQAEHPSLLDNSYSLREAFRMVSHDNDIGFGAGYIDRVCADADAYENELATAYSTARQAFAASPVYNDCDPGFCARCYLIEVLVSLADKVFVTITGCRSRTCKIVTDALHHSYQGVASKQRTNDGGRLADVAVANAILKRIFEKEVGE